MSFDFPLIITTLLILSAVIGGIDLLFFSPKRKAIIAQGGECKLPKIAAIARDYFWVLLAVWIIRGFIARPFVVPTGSLKPTIMPGDFTLVSQFSYGLRLPVWGTNLLNTWNPQRGDIAVVKWRVNPRIDFVKRVIGVPGDVISMHNKVLTINGKVCKQTFVRNAVDSDSVDGPHWPVKVYQENLLGVKHLIYRNPAVPAVNFTNLKIPKGEYLLMGDNRDNSDDGRDWGLTKRSAFVGKAILVWLSWDSKTHWIRWHRIGTMLTH